MLYVPRGPGRWFLNRATLLRPDALTGGAAQRGGCAAPAAVRPRLLRGLPQPHAPVRPRAANISTFSTTSTLKSLVLSVRPSEVQQKAIEEPPLPSMTRRYESMHTTNCVTGVPGLPVQAAAGERGREAAGVPEVPGALHHQGRRRAHAARRLRHPRRLSSGSVAADLARMLALRPIS